MASFGLQGKWAVDLVLSGYGQMCDITGFEALKLVEEAGNQLPTFDLQIKTPDPGILSYAVEGNTITAGMGVAQIDLGGIQLKIMKTIWERADGSSWRLYLNGFYNAVEYLNNTETKISDKVCALAHMQDVVGKHFTPDFSTTLSNDLMNWIHHGITPQAMVQQLWTHADLGNTNFPMIGITTDGTFRLRTMKDISQSNYAWEFSNTKPAVGNVVPFHYDYELHNAQGLANNLASYPQGGEIINLESGLADLFKTASDTFLSQSSGLGQIGSILTKAVGAVLQNDNIHDNYHQSHKDNVANMATVSANQLYVNNSDIYFPIKTLDKILFGDQVDSGSSAPSFSGEYITTTVTRIVEHGKFVTKVIAVRDGMNNVQNGSS